MKKLVSLIKACMTDNMSLFKIKNKKSGKKSNAILPIFLGICVFFSIWSYANIIIEPLIEVKLEYVLLTLFVLLTSILTLVEGIYKTSSLLFNCKDDNLLLSLPIKKSTVLFVRVFKFYVFELIYNTLFMLPAMVVYARYVNVGATYYIASFCALVLLPIIPIVISCIIGAVISKTSSQFRLKNLAQIVITTIILLIVFYASFNLENLVKDMAQNAESINNIITRIYYPAGAYIKLVTNFNITDLIVFIIINLLLFVASIFVLSKIYFNINSKVKEIKTSAKIKTYKIKANNPIKALIKKEMRRFIDTPVFVINAGFGLVLFIVGCIAICLKFDGVVETFNNEGINITKEQIASYIPVLLFGFICLSSLMTSITSSMISLEGKAFNILKSLPVKPFKIILAKVLASIIIMVPCILIGDFIMFIKFRFNILEVLMMLSASVILPLVAETIGIIVNLNYPKMDAENDTEVVKQSMSSMVAVFTGMILTGISIFALYKGLALNISVDLIILCGLIIYTVVYLGLLIYLSKKGTEKFNDINV